MWYSGMDSNPRLLCGTQGWIRIRDCYVVRRDGFELETVMWYSGMDSNPRLLSGTQGWIRIRDCHVVLRDGFELKTVMWYSLLRDGFKPGTAASTHGCPPVYIE